MDTSAEGISFDSGGRCNYCVEFEAELEVYNSSRPERQQNLKNLVCTIKNKGRGKQYDCVVGVSGGTDSSYALYLAVQQGLRPLAVHLDNGWNSELATANIARLVDSLDVDLHTHVIEWEENKELQKSFFSADVVDIELLTDNAIFALNYQQASQHGVGYILSGENLTTEGMRMPEGWYHYKYDARNIRAIQKEFGSVAISSHPLISTIQFVYMEYVKRIRRIPFLNYFEYDKSEATKVLEQGCGYRQYEYKHYESVFTRFYQAVILPTKFGVDKRRVHLSSLIMTGQMSRFDAESMLAEPPYSDRDQERIDQRYVQKKLDLSDEEFATYLGRPAVEHAKYGSELKLQQFFLRMYKLGRKLALKG